jgi:hypothetical protein
MTGTRDPQQDGSIHAMLCDSGLESAAELRSALEQLRTVVPEAAPAPRADLAALLVAGAAGAAAPVSATTTALPMVSTTALPVVASAEDAVDESLPAGVTSLAERRGRKRRLAIVGGAVVGAMTLGAGAVAASSEDFRHSVSQSVSVIFQPAGHGTPATDHVQPSPSSVPAIPVPRATPAATGTPGVPPAGTAAPSTASRGASSNGKARPTTAPTAPPAVGRDGILPTPGQRPVAPGIPGAPGEGKGNGNGNGNGKDLPRTPGNVTPSLPGVVPNFPDR